MSQDLIAQKISQAQSLVAEEGLDAWLTFVRETYGFADPALPFLVEGGLTWQSALIITPDKAVAVVGRYDADPLRSAGHWDEVIGYDRDIAPDLKKAVDGHAKIGVNWSRNDTKADGLSHGMKLLLDDMLGTDRLVSAEPLLFRLRGQKTSAEIARIKASIVESERIFGEIETMLPSRPSEREVYDRVQAGMRSAGLDFSWDPHGDPIVNHGPDSMKGHGVPNPDLRPADGMIAHVDLGVRRDGYSADIQRDWFIGEDVPEDVRKGCDAVNAAISAGAAILRPGALGHEVDAAARKSIVEAGYEEYHHALGHQVGRDAHDGGAILGPQWERYGETPNIPVRENEVYTLELGVDLPGRGYLGIEEMVQVTADGCEFLTERMLAMPTVTLD